MTIRVATILSAREWESALVSHAKETASLRVVLRAYRPADIELHASDIDVVVAGGEVSWVTSRQITTWRRLGFGVVGVHPAGDGPAAQLLEAGGANEVVPDSIDTPALVQAIRFVAPMDERVTGSDRGRVVSVMGPRGAPGCTEIALAIASSLCDSGSAVLVDADISAPALAVRLALPPRPDVTDAADGVRADGAISPECLHRVGRLSVVTGSHRPGEARLRDTMIAGVIDAAAAQFDYVVVDIGADSDGGSLVEESDSVLFVVDGSAIGIVRAAQITSRWIGPQPALILNRVDPRDRAQVVDATRKWTGLEPAAVVLDRRKVRRATAAAKMPDRKFKRSLSAVGAFR